jgi:surface carbohydrate biosynthesis protein
MRWVFRRNFSCDLLVVDTIGKGWLKTCLPDYSKIELLNIREERIFLLDVRFTFRLLMSCLWQSVQKDGTLGYAWLSTLLHRLSPRIIVSCADNNALLARFATEHPNIPVVLIQNAMRDTKESFNTQHDLPHYLSFGAIEARVLASLNLRCQVYQPVGSVKLGLALERWRQSSPTVYDLAFISHYRSEMFDDNCNPIQGRIEHCQHWLFATTVEYAQKSKLGIVVLLKTREHELQAAEKHYYEQLAGNLPIRFIVADKAGREFDTYIAGLSSSLVIHPGSTLGFELFAAGKKVIFGASIDPELIDMWGVQPYFDILPSAVKLPVDCETNNFFELCDDLASCEEQDYLLMSKDAAHSIVSMPEAMRPDQAIRKFISSML